MPVFITDKSVREDGVTLERALSVGCGCCGAPSGLACGTGGDREANAKRGAFEWGDFCPYRLQWIQNHGTQTSMSIYSLDPDALDALLDAAP